MAGGSYYADSGHHSGHPAAGPPPGELVQVYTQANPNYRLTVRQDGAVLAFKNIRDVFQQWIKVDVGPGHGGFIDREGQPGFILVNNGTGVPLKHGDHLNEFVSTHRQVFAASNPLEGSIIWSLGKKDEGLGFRGLRPVTNITLNLDAEHADKAHGGVRDGNRLVLSSWKDLENFKWKIEHFVPGE